MTELFITPWLITAIFLMVAIAYSSIGLGGGSTYTALLVISGFFSDSIPLISLSLNLLVTSIGSYYFIRQGHLRYSLILPFLLTSLPMAWVGGMLQVSPVIFQALLLISLLFVVFRIYFMQDTAFHLQISQQQKLLISLIAGGLLGLLAGIVGIGGGIYLVPLILILGLGSIKEAAACGAIFVWLNSLVGLVSRLQYNYVDLSIYYPLLAAVIIGGIFGSKLGSSGLPVKRMEKLLGLIVVVAAGLLTRNLIMSA